MFKLIFGTFRLLLLLLVLVLIFHNLAARQALRGVLSWQLGVPVEVESARVDFLGSQVLFKGVVVRNPEGFPDGHIVKIPYLTLYLDSGAFFDGHFRFKKIEADISDFQVLRAANGRINWLNLRIIQEMQKAPAIGRSFSVKTDRFVLTLRRASYRDYSAPQSQPKVFMVDLEQREYPQTDSLERMVQIISWEALSVMGMEKIGAGVWRIPKTENL